MLNFTKLKVTFVYLVLLVLVFFASLNLKNNNLLDKQVNLGLDLQGGSYILLEIDTNPLISQRIQNKVIPIKKLLNEDELYKLISINSRNTIQHFYNCDKFYKELLKIVKI